MIEFPDMGLEVMPAVASADVGVLLTPPGRHAEGCSNSIMEYMALGLPVVCTDNGGNREIVDDHVTGLVIPPSDVDALVDALRVLSVDPRLRAQFGAAGSVRWTLVCLLRHSYRDSRGSTKRRRARGEIGRSVGRRLRTEGAMAMDHIE